MRTHDEEEFEGCFDPKTGMPRAGVTAHRSSTHSRPRLPDPSFSWPQPAQG
jgi:hypothetical protein